MHDEKIISAIRARDEAAIHSVILNYSRLLWSVAGRVLDQIGSPQDVEECVADVFIYLWEHPEKYDPRRGSLKTWLAIVARTRATDRCRQLLRRDAVPLEETVFADQPEVVDGILAEDAKKALAAAVNDLGEPEHEILIRRYYYQQKPKEIALTLDMTVKQVDNCLYRTKRKLREAIS